MLEATLVVGALAYLGRPVLIPVSIAAVLALLLVPPMKWLERMRLPRTLAAFLVVAGLLGAVGVTVWQVSGPAMRWVDRAPSALAQARDRLRELQQPMAQMAQAADQVEKLTRPGEEDATRTVEVAGSPTLSSRLLGGTWSTLTSGVIVTVLTFFLLAMRPVLFRKLVRMFATTEQRRRATRAARGVRRRLSRHFGTVAVINTVLGAAVGAACWVLGMPSPALWGVMAGILNFVPYLGAITGVSIVALAGLTTLEGATGFLPALAYAMLTGIEGTLVTPAILGRRLRLNPLAIVVGVLVLGLLWGPAGVLLAVPLLVATMVVAEHHPNGRRIRMLLGR